MFTSTDRKRILWFNLALVPGVAALLLLYNLFTHTLFQNGNWTSTKTGLEKSVMGSWAFMVNYRALIHNQLDLGTWHGHQEIFLKQPESSSEVTCDVKLADSAAVVIYFGRMGDTLCGVRLSDNPLHPAAYLEVVDDEFVVKRPVPVVCRPGRWNRIRIDKTAGGTSVILNQEVTPILLTKRQTSPEFGFRGYSQQVLVDRICFRDPHGKILFSEDFNRKPEKLAYGLVILLCGNIIFLLMRKSGKWMIALAIHFSIFMSALLIYFWLHGRYQYPKEWMINWKSALSHQPSLGVQTKKVIGLDDYRTDTASFKILFLGSSQTWGAGASAEEKTFIRLFQDHVSGITGKPVQCLNAAVPGIRSDSILAEYRHLWLHFHPQICIINLSLNDAGNAGFRDNLRKIYQINLRRNIITVLIPEPVEGYIQANIDNQNIMRDLAAEYSIPVIEAEPALNARMDDGFIFWDFVHLTDFGHRVFAACLAEGMDSLLVNTIQPEPQ
jgi:lysophospholipase L1-like esterase